jgi:hypothetical protein
MTHYIIRNANDAGASPVNRRSAKSAWLAVREMQRGGKTNIVVIDHDGKSITLQELSARATEERGE